MSSTNGSPGRCPMATCIWSGTPFWCRRISMLSEYCVHSVTQRTSFCPAALELASLFSDFPKHFFWPNSSFFVYPPDMTNYRRDFFLNFLFPWMSQTITTITNLAKSFRPTATQFSYPLYLYLWNFSANLFSSRIDIIAWWWCMGHRLIFENKRNGKMLNRNQFYVLNVLFKNNHSV